MNTCRRAAKLFLTLTALTATLAPAWASTASWAIQGVVSEVLDPQNLLGGIITVGASIGGTATYDTALPDSNAVANVAHHVHHVAPFGLALQVSGLSIVSDPGDPNFWVQIFDDLNGKDGWSFIAYSLSPLAAGLLLNHAFVELEDDTHSALAGTTLTEAPPPLSAFGSLRRISFTGCAPNPQDGCNDFSVRATITSIEALPGDAGAPLPVPAPALLLLSTLPLACRARQGRETRSPAPSRDGDHRHPSQAEAR